MKAQCAAVLLAHCSLSVRCFLVKNTNSDTSSVESTQLARKHTPQLFSNQRRPFNSSQVIELRRHIRPICLIYADTLFRSVEHLKDKNKAGHYLFHYRTCRSQFAWHYQSNSPLCLGGQRYHITPSCWTVVNSCNECYKNRNNSKRATIKWL